MIPERRYQRLSDQYEGASTHLSRGRTFAQEPLREEYDPYEGEAGEGGQQGWVGEVHGQDAKEGI